MQPLLLHRAPSTHLPVSCKAHLQCHLLREAFTSLTPQTNGDYSSPLDLSLPVGDVEAGCPLHPCQAPSSMPCLQLAGSHSWKTLASLQLWVPILTAEMKKINQVSAGPCLE